MKHLLAGTTCLIGLTAAIPAFAQSTPEAQVAGLPSSASLDEVVVSASRVAQRRDQVGASVTVLDKAAIQASQAVVVSDLLAQTPGVSFSRNGGIGGTTSLRIRGAEAEQTVLVLDGVKLSDTASAGGAYNFGNLLIGDVARIEVLRGGQSTLWGSQAIGGVVNVVTAEPTEPVQASLEAEGGSHETAYARAGIGGNDGRLVWRVAGAFLTTDGTSTFANGRERDGYRNSGGNARLRYSLTDDVSVDLRGQYSRGRNEFDGFPAPLFAFADTREYGTTEEFIGYAGLNVGLLNGRLKNRLAFSYSSTDRDNFNPDQTVTTRTFDSLGRSRRLEYQGTAAVADGVQAVFGVERENSRMRSASPTSFTPDPVPVARAIHITSVYGQLQVEPVEKLTLTGGVRHDDHSTFGGHTLGQVAAAWAVNDGDTVLRASFGQGFKAPTLFQLYSEFGNTGLKPEKANSWDAGVEHRIGEIASVSATWFQRRTRDQVDFVSCGATSANVLCVPGKSGVYDNIGKTRARGVELAGALTLGALTLQANYTLTDTRNITAGSANRGKRLPRRPLHAANLSATYLWPVDLSTTVAVRYAGDSYDAVSNTFKLEHYTLVDLRVSYPLVDGLELYGRIENLMDEQYQTVRNYGTLGRTAYAGLRATF